MGYMQKDGISGHVTDQLDRTDVTVLDTRPEDHPFVRITHFPYEAGRVDYDRTDDHDGDGLPFIPLGEMYEVTVWDNRNKVRESWHAVNGIERAVSQAVDIATEEDLPIWNTVRRLRPETVLVDHEPMETITGEYELAIRETEDGWLAVNRATDAANWGATREDALAGLED